MKTRMRRRFVLVVATAILASGSALAADPVKPAPADPSPEQRHEMAKVHQQMADCLSSTRPMAECRAEMQKSCQAMMGKDGCSMMGSGMMDSGMMQGQGAGMMQGAPSPAPPSGSHEEHGH